MTEDEAKTKWCPMARPAFGSNAGEVLIAVAEQRTVRLGAAGQIEYASQACIGSACMAWRGNNGPAQDTGFCGLAGAPQ